MGRKKNIFSVIDTNPYELSRSGIEDFIQCKRCFYLHKKYGIKQSSMFGNNTLNKAVDTLLKAEFDLCRIENRSHSYLIERGIDAIPLSLLGLDIDTWRKGRGIKYHHEATNFIVTGAVDDVWRDHKKNELIIVEYKATSTKEEITLDKRDPYKRQIEIYQWLFRKNCFAVSDTGYFVYCNGDSGREKFENILHFKIELLPYKGNDSWVEDILFDIKACLVDDVLPSFSEDCDYCVYYNDVNHHIVKHQ